MGLARIEVTRTWDRDGSTNVMSLEAAVDNLYTHFHGDIAKEHLRRRLLACQEVRTGHATLRANLSAPIWADPPLAKTG